MDGTGPALPEHQPQRIPRGQAEQCPSPQRRPGAQSLPPRAGAAPAGSVLIANPVPAVATRPETSNHRVNPTSREARTPMSPPNETMTFINTWFASTDVTISALIWQYECAESGGVRYEAMVLKRNQNQGKLQAPKYSELITLLERSYGGAA